MSEALVTPASLAGKGSRRRLLRLGAGLVALSLVASCEYPNDAITVENQSTQTVSLAMVSDDTRIDLTTLRPGEEHSLRNECVEMDLVIENETGEELARRPGPFCRGDPTWIITDELLGTA